MPVPSPTYETEAEVTGQRRLGQWWYQCAYCGKWVPEEKTVGPDEMVLTREQRGYRRCTRCIDQPGFDDYEEERSQIVAALSAAEAESRSKEP